MNRLALLQSLAMAAAAAALVFLSRSGAHWVALPAYLFGAFAILRGLNAIAPSLPRPLCTAVRWAYAQLVEIFALAALIPLRIASLFRTDRPVAPDLKRRPILLVHGYLNSGYVWEYHKKQLAKNGFGPIYTVNLGFPFHSIRTFAEKVKKKAQQIANETGRSDLTLVGHSMGGLVSAYYALRHAAPEDIYQVIAIGSPLQGTHVAKLGLGKCAREMEIDSDLVNELKEGMDLRADIRFYTIGTKTDELVIPHTSCHPASAVKSYLIDDIGHASMLFSRRVARKLAEWIETENTLIVKKGSPCFDAD